jgi:hypothetical protein
MRIVTVLIAIIASIPAFILSYLLLTLFPHIPMFLYYAVVFGIIVGGGYYYITQKRKYYIENDMVDSMPDSLGNVTILYLVIGTAIGTFGMSNNNRSRLYVDNGTDREITFKIKHEGDFKIPPQKHIKIDVVTGENIIEIEGKTKIFNVATHRNWVYNIDSQSVYLLTNVNYTNPNILYKEGTKPADTGDADGQIIKNEFFETDAAYIFDIPEKITVDKSSSKENVSRKALIKMKRE